MNGANHLLARSVSDVDLGPPPVDDLLPLTSQAPTPKRSVPTSARPDLNLKAGNWIRGMEPLLNRLAACDVPVLLQGETGVGKEVLARHIHDQSLRAGKIFLKLNCAALPSELVESELFGYEKGAFTGAFKSTPGKFELADGGTILLDEIGDMDLRLQAKLLQVLQDHEFHRIGAKEATQVDVRVIAATHRDLADRISREEFREDLYYRLNVFNIVVPPLRERTDEIIPLALAFLKKHASAHTPIPEIGPALRIALLNHHWPGNIRELENVMRRYLVIRNPEMILDELQGLTSRALNRDRLPSISGPNDGSPRANSSVMANADLIGKVVTTAPAERLSPVLAANGRYAVNQSEHDGSRLAKLDQVRQAAEIEVITNALYSTQWNRKRAASLLGVDYKALLYKMKKLGID
jgi:transcriptional regulator with PAS, ATPase and Fis domain